MCVYAGFKIITPAEALLVENSSKLVMQTVNTDVCLETDRSHENLLHRDRNRKQLSVSRHTTRNLVKNCCVPQKKRWSETG